MAKSGKSPVLGEQERRDADRLRQFRNQLIQMTSEFVERSKRYPISEAAEFEKWLTNDFSPRFQEFRRKLMESDLPAQPLEALLKATDCLANAMMQPDRSDLRVSTTDEALEAAAVVDVFIDSLARGR